MPLGARLALKQPWQRRCVLARTPSPAEPSPTRANRCHAPHLCPPALLCCLQEAADHSKRASGCAEPQRDGQPQRVRLGGRAQRDSARLPAARLHGRDARYAPAGWRRWVVVVAGSRRGCASCCLAGASAEQLEDAPEGLSPCAEGCDCPRWRWLGWLAQPVYSYLHQQAPSCFEPRAERCWRWPLQREFQFDSTPPVPTGAQFLAWTQSRKLLEVAIAAEQQRTPEQQAPQSTWWPGAAADEWQAVAAAEERLRRRLNKFKLDLFVMEGGER